MDEVSSDTLGNLVGLKDGEGPDSLTGMETTVSAELSPEEEAELLGKVRPHRFRSVDLSFLTPSNRAGSLGRIGEYEIVGVLGRGSMGLVLKGHDRSLDRHVAVKVQDPSIAINRSARARFLREARAAAAISDPRVVTIHKVNAVQEQPFLVMEFVAGTLREKIKSGVPLLTFDVIHIAEQVALGLAAAHAEGVLHRDIKPANILLDEVARKVKISDFGLAVAGLEATAAASTGRVAGTPGYMSPEQARGEKLDARSDLFSLGCVIYAMFAGKSPFSGETTDSILSAVCDEDPDPPPVPLGCPVAAGVAELVLKLLAKDRENRPSTAHEVAEILSGLRNRSESASEIASRIVIAVDEETEPEIDIPTTRVEPDSQATNLVPSEVESSLSARRFPWKSITVGSVAFFAIGWLVLAIFLPRPSGKGPWTVGQSAGSDFQKLTDALQYAVPGTTLILTDSSTHVGPFRLNDPTKFQDLTIESQGSRATLSSESGESVVTITGVSGITIRNVEIAPQTDQFAVLISGNAQGTTLDRLTIHSPKGSLWTQVYLCNGATGSAERPITISNSTFEVSHGGVTIEGRPNRPTGHIQILGNRFEGDDEQVHVLSAVNNIAIKKNIFCSGQSITINLGRDRGKSIAVENNTFWHSRVWIHPADSDPQQEKILVSNNAIFGSKEIDNGLSKMAQGNWFFQGNLWEHSIEITESADNSLAAKKPRLEVLSRDPKDPRFLRPTSDSNLAKAEGNSTFVGAVAPEETAVSPPPQ